MEPHANPVVSRPRKNWSVSNHPVDLLKQKFIPPTTLVTDQGNLQKREHPMQGHPDRDVSGVATVDCLWVTRPQVLWSRSMAATPPGREDHKKEASFTPRVSSPWRRQAMLLEQALPGGIVTLSTRLHPKVSER